MATFFKQIQDGLKGLWIYSLCFSIIFNFIFLPRFVDGGEAFGMFNIVSFFMQLLIFALFPLTIAVLSYLITRVNTIAKAIVLFLISEVVLSLLIGNISLFGLFETATPNVSKDLQSRLLVFDKSRDFALSMSSLISVVVYFVAVSINKERKRQLLTQYF
jgi:hypothetical protein